MPMKAALMRLLLGLLRVLLEQFAPLYLSETRQPNIDGLPKSWPVKQQMKVVWCLFLICSMIYASIRFLEHIQKRCTLECLLQWKCGYIWSLLCLKSAKSWLSLCESCFRIWYRVMSANMKFLCACSYMTLVYITTGVAFIVSPCTEWSKK